MSKIVALSLYGFKLDSLKNDWDKVDKSLLHRDIFNSLVKGVEIEVKERNSKGFITSFKVLGLDKDKVSISNQPLVNSSPIQEQIVKNGMIYGQCVNLAFNHVSNLSF